MAQESQFLLTKGSATINVQPDALTTYLADGWAIHGLRYSEGGEGLDVTSLVLMTNGSASIYVRAGSVATYIANGYTVVGIIYGSSAVTIANGAGNVLHFLDTPAFSSAEVGTVAATEVAVTFTTEIAATNYAAGVTIKVNGASKTISAAVRQTGNLSVHYTIPAVAFGDTVTWEYDDLTGQIVSANDSTPLDDVSAKTVTNNVAE